MSSTATTKSKPKLRNILDTSILSANALTAHRAIENWNDSRYVPILDLLISILDELIYPKETELQESHPNSDENELNNGTKYTLNLGIHSGKSTGLFADFNNENNNSSNNNNTRSERQEVIDTVIKVLKQAQFRVINSNSVSEDKSVTYSTLEWEMIDKEIGIDIWELQSLTEVWFVLLSKRHTLIGEREIWVLSNKNQENLKQAMRLMAQQSKVAPLSDASASVNNNDSNNDKNVSENNKSTQKSDDSKTDNNTGNDNNNNVEIDTSNKQWIMYTQLAHYIMSLNDEFLIFDRLNNFTFGNIDITANHMANMVLSDYLQENMINKVLSKPEINNNKSMKLNIIDMGCGWGNVGKAFNNKDISYKEGILSNDISKFINVNLHGLDNNINMLTIGKIYKNNEYYTKYPKPKENNELYSYQLCDCQKQRIPFKDHTIDGIISVNYLLANNNGVLTKNNSGYGEFVELPSNEMKNEIYRILRHPLFSKKTNKKKDLIPGFILVLFQCLHPNIRVLDVDLRNVFMLDNNNNNNNDNDNNTSSNEDMKNDEKKTDSNNNVKNEDFGLKLVKAGRLKEYIYGIWEHKLLSEIEKEKDEVFAMEKHEEYQVLREQLKHLNMTVDDEGTIMPISPSLDGNTSNDANNQDADVANDDQDTNATMATS